MKYSIYDSTRIEDIPREVTELHAVRPLSKKKLKKIISKCIQLKEITMSESTFKRMNKSIKKIQSKKINVRIESNRGRAIEIPLKKIQQVIEMRKDFRPLREIEETLGIPKSTVHYLVKYAERKKIKAGKKIVYLK